MTFTSPLSGPSSLRLLEKVVCPHCWAEFASEDAVWIATHSSLYGDEKLGESELRRFLPTRFTPNNRAIDPEGSEATETGCPQCHLKIPRRLFEIPVAFFSILGAPGSGKSYLLASMIWQARRSMAERFQILLTDADAAMNARLIEYEERQFLSNNPDQLTSLPKTEEQGTLYNRVQLGDRAVNLPRPFLFTLSPGEGHPHEDKKATLSRVLCLYDNAGESFLPGADESTGPVTGHLARSEALLFCFDPTQDPRFRAACSGLSADPQMTGEGRSAGQTIRQDSILLEAINRVRQKAGMREDEKINATLVILVTKWDAWQKLLPDVNANPPFGKVSRDREAIDEDRILETSSKLRDLLRQTCPELTAAAATVSNSVVYMPVSATGRRPEMDPKTGQLGIRPKDIRPQWAEVSLIYLLARRFRGLIDVGHRKEDQPGSE
ncbi:hypothetical protein LOC67_19070 [Stieleria sp. JC731]|uniref:hypothetical protein n=1 Tax=Pirellulaceae TaxID=2691357 RepID=UPI001E59B0A3|nr:hypothetical protein [Stieleria sp. JC731]MCC9602657.1 hypothetical protein [Stieleria sp. JC731]